MWHKQSYYERHSTKLQQGILRDIRHSAISQKSPPPKKGFRNTDRSAFSQSPKDHNEDRAREGAVSHFENGDPDADDDVSLLSMGSLAHGDRAGGMNIGAVPSSIRDKKPLARQKSSFVTEQQQ